MFYQMAAWSSGMIPASGAGGPGFNPRQGEPFGLRTGRKESGVQEVLLSIAGGRTRAGRVVHGIGLLYDTVPIFQGADLDIVRCDSRSLLQEPLDGSRETPSGVGG